MDSIALLARFEKTVGAGDEAVIFPRGFGAKRTVTPPCTPDARAVGAVIPFGFFRAGR